MIWRIFRKDWKLLWPLALGVAVLHLFLRLVLARIGLFPGFRVFPLVNLLVIGGYMGSIVLIILAVQLDSLPGVRQDWLVRPISRRNLLMAKILFVLIAVQAPLFLAEVMEGLAAGFPLAASITAPLGRSVWLVLMMDLPILAFATLTSNLMEAVFSGLILFLLGAVCVVMFNLLAIPQPTMDTGIQWITTSAMATTAAIAAALILTIQYRSRKTLPAMYAFTAAGLLWLFVLLTPWQPAFALERHFSPSPGSASRVSISWRPNAERFQPPPGTDVQEGLRGNLPVVTTSIYLPVRLDNVPAGSLLLTDHAQAHLTAGTAIDVEEHTLLRPDTEHPERAYQLLRVPSAWLMAHENEPVHLDIEYSLTLAALSSERVIAAAGGDLRSPDLGWCQTRINETDTQVQIHCLKPGRQPDVTVFRLENVAAALANPERPVYAPDYSPYFHAFEPDSMGRLGVSLPFRDPSGLTRYPVDGSQLGKAQVAIRTYKACDHFTRRLTLEGIRLRDWRAHV